MGQYMSLLALAAVGGGVGDLKTKRVQGLASRVTNQELLHRLSLRFRGRNYCRNLGLQENKTSAICHCWH